MRNRFRFAYGTRVRLKGGRMFPDNRGVRHIVQREMRHKGDIYWLDRPISGLSCFHGDDLERVPTGPGALTPADRELLQEALGWYVETSPLRARSARRVRRVARRLGLTVTYS